MLRRSFPSDFYHGLLVQDAHESSAQRRSHNLAALLELGFECADEPWTGESASVGAGLWRLTQSIPAMGTVVTVSVLADSEARAAAAAGVAFTEMTRAVDLLNRYDGGSAVGALNADRRLTEAPDELLHLLHRARAVHLLSAGAFDITVTPVVDALRAHREAGLPGLPDAALLESASARIDAQAVDVSQRRVRLRNDVQITLDGIAKGYIVDLMAGRLDDAGVAGYLINAGGDIRAGGSRDGTAPWSVGVRDPFDDNAQLDVLPIYDGAVATSGSYEIYFDGERTRHHIVNAGGTSPGECCAVTVRAPNALLADALATAAFVAGPGAATALVESVPGCSCVLVTAQGEQRISSTWASGSGRSGGV